MSKQHYQASTYKAQNSVGYLIKRAHSMMLDVLEQVFADRGFSYIQYVILSWLRDGIAVNPKDICIQFRHDSGALTRVIDQLADRGLLERVRRDRDRRKVELQLTEAGRETVEAMIPLVVEKLNLALTDFSTEEVQEFLRLLLKLNTRLQSTLDSKAAPAPAADTKAPAGSDA
ncbi:MAG TPA: MarR family winged helix-turn-helix transcriptional regulator [Steroidobacteraceae bacterium]